ncbi:MAG: energy transducer TonB [Luteimonas sp.]|nr:energy transducer TonB [Luteimonas sp.]
MFACIVVALVAVPALALAGGPSVRDQVESSMVLTGTIDVAPDGKVSGYSIDRAVDVPDGVLGLFARFIPGWRFEPVRVDGQPATVRADMSMRVVARRLGGDNFRVSIRDTRFSQKRSRASAASARGSMRAPRYPRAAARAGVSGTVYTVLRIGHDGRVLDAFAEQVDLRVVASEHALARWRELMADAALDAARSWNFPASPEHADGEVWIVRIPVDFALGRKDRYGEWLVYVPGPWQPPPWAGVRLAGSPGALPASGVFPVGGELRLLTPAGSD